MNASDPFPTEVLEFADGWRARFFYAIRGDGTRRLRYALLYWKGELAAIVRRADDATPEQTAALAVRVTFRPQMIGRHPLVTDAREPGAQDFLRKEVPFILMRCPHGPGKPNPWMSPEPWARQKGDGT